MSRFCSIQQLGIGNTDLSFELRCNLHIIAIALLSLLGRVTGVNNILEYCEKVIEARREETPYLLPPLIDPNWDNEKRNINLPHLMLDKVSFVRFLNYIYCFQRHDTDSTLSSTTQCQ